MESHRTPIHKILTEDVEARIIAYGEVHQGSWGSLHTFWEDGNVDDKSMSAAMLYALDKNDAEGYWLLSIIGLLSISQRLKLIRGWLYAPSEEKRPQPVRKVPGSVKLSMIDPAVVLKHIS